MLMVYPENIRMDSRLSSILRGLRMAHVAGGRVRRSGNARGQ